MSITSLLPIGGVAMGALAARAIGELSDGISFRNLLNEPRQDSAGTKAVESAREKAEAELNERLPQFSRRLHDRLKSAGIIVSQPFTLKYNGFGTPVVDGDHPGCAAIEEILTQDPELAEELRAIASAAGILRDQDLTGATGSRFGEFRLDVGIDTASIRFE